MQSARVRGMETKLVCCKWSVGLTTEVPALKAQESQPSHTLPLQLQAFASLLYMEGASGNGGCSQEALRGPVGPTSGLQDYLGQVKPAK